MKLEPTALIPFLIESDLPERVEAASDKRAADGYPLATVLLDVLFHGADALCPECYADARDFLLHVTPREAIALLAWASEPMEDLWAERWAMGSSRGQASCAVYVSEYRVQADEIIEGLYTDALLFPGDRDLTPASASAAVALSLRRGVGSPFWWRARSVWSLRTVKCSPTRSQKPRCPSDPWRCFYTRLGASPGAPGGASCFRCGTPMTTSAASTSSGSSAGLCPVEEWVPIRSSSPRAEDPARKDTRCTRYPKTRPPTPSSEPAPGP